MLGFLKKFKKKKKDDDSDSPPRETAGDESASAEEGADPQKSKTDKTSGKKKKKLPVKLIIVVLVVLVCVGGAGFTVYTLYFSGPEESSGPIYQKRGFTYVDLPEEMLRFSFDHLPETYQALIRYDIQMTLLDREIARIEAVGQQYPDQKTIADKEKKVWQKTRDSLEKAFLKILKPVKDLYVLYRVNPEQGEEQINTRKNELAEQAAAALAPAGEMTGKRSPKESVPEGMLQKTWYTIKKKFL